MGAHLSIAGGLHKALVRGKELGCDAVQIFTGNRNRWEKRKLCSTEIDAFHQARMAAAVEPVAAHNSYLINLASPLPEMVDRSRKALREELTRVEILGIPYLVMHPGSHMGTGESAGLRQVAEGLDRVFGEV